MVKLLLTGSVGQDVVDDVIERARAAGFYVRELPERAPSTEPGSPGLELNAPLSTILQSRSEQPAWYNGRLHQFMLATGARQIGDLAAVSRQEFIDAHPNNVHSWDLEFAILEFMARFGIDFADGGLVEWLGSKIDGDKRLGVRACNRLVLEGVTWMRMLTFMTKADLLDIRGLGHMGVDRIRGTLAREGMSLKDE